MMMNRLQWFQRMGLVFMAITTIPLMALAANSPREYEIEGTVQVMPPKKIGNWKIQGKTVKVTAQTHLDEHECPLKVGAFAEAEGHYVNQVLVATEIECDIPD